MFHKDHPWKKGLWIWYIKDCLNGDIDAIIKKCHDYDISYLLIKSGNGTNIWTQINTDLVQRLHGAGIKVYSWSYVYGDEPLKEAEVATHSLGLGVDGHVFDAEGEYERLQDNTAASETMLKTVREKYPGAFLAYAPFPVIDYHTKFPYVTFGKYCDAVMPQIYYGTMQMTPQAAILRMYDNFVRWQKNWMDSGHSDSVKPIIPVGQVYDNKTINPPYILNPADIASFVSIIKGYKSVNFWSFQHLEREDCWAAIRDAKLDEPTDAERGVQAQEVQTPPVQAAIEPQTAPPETSAPAQQEAQAEPEQSAIAQTTAPIETIIEEAQSVAGPTVEIVDATAPVEQPAPVTTTTTSTQTFAIPTDKPSTIVVTPNDKHPDGMEVKVYTAKTHREYFIAFVQFAAKQIALLLKIKIF